MQINVFLDFIPNGAAAHFHEFSQGSLGTNRNVLKPAGKQFSQVTGEIASKFTTSMYDALLIA